MKAFGNRFSHAKASSGVGELVARDIGKSTWDTNIGAVAETKAAGKSFAPGVCGAVDNITILSNSYGNPVFFSIVFGDGDNWVLGGICFWIFAVVSDAW